MSFQRLGNKGKEENQTDKCSFKIVQRKDTAETVREKQHFYNWFSGRRE